MEPAATPEVTPKLLRLDRRLLVHMGAAKELCIYAAGGSFAVKEQMLAFIILGIRLLLAYYQNNADIANPLPPLPVPPKAK